MEGILPNVFLAFGFGVLILLLASLVFVKLAEKLSAALRISPLIIGITVVALGTSLPELAVSGIGAIKGDTGLSLGNIIGSNIVNVLMVFSIGIMIGNLRIGTQKTQRNAVALGFVTFLFFALQIVGINSKVVGLVLIALSLIFTFQEYELGVEGRMHEDAKKFKNKRAKKLSLVKIFLLIASIAGVIVGGLLVVSSVEGISQAVGYSTTILGLSLTAIATSIPELLTTIFSQGDDEEKLTAGNIIGSNIYNLLLVGGISLLFSTSVYVRVLDWALLGFVTLLFIFILKRFKGRVVPKRVGLLLFVGFFGFLALLGLSKNV